jgi:hypothetical protein
MKENKSDILSYIPGMTPRLFYAWCQPELVSGSYKAQFCEMLKRVQQDIYAKQ